MNQNCIKHVYKQDCFHKILHNNIINHYALPWRLQLEFMNADLRSSSGKNNKLAIRKYIFEDEDIIAVIVYIIYIR